MTGAVSAADPAPLVWSEAMTGLDGGPVDELLVDPRDPDRVFALTNRRGVFGSTEGARTWKSLPIGLSDFFTWLRMEPKDPQVLWVSTHEGLQVSRDGGQRWESAQKLVPVTGVATLEFDPGSEGVVRYLRADSRLLYKSADSGATWQPLMSPNSEEQLQDLSISPADPQRIYGHSFAGVIVSRDGGATWGPAAPLPEKPSIHSLAADLKRPDSVIVSTEKGVFKSTDGGTSWKPSGTGLPALTDRADTMLTVSHAQPGTLFLSLGLTNEEPLYVSRDDGASWSKLASPPVWLPRPLAIAPSRPERMYTGTGAGVMRTDDGGRTWTNETRGLSARYHRGFTVHPSKPSVVYHVGMSGIARSGDAGATWSSLDATGVTRLASALLVIPAEPRALYAVTHGDILRSPDAGATWAPLTPGRPFKAAYLALDAAHAGTWHVVQQERDGSKPRSVHQVTLDAGKTWQPLAKPISITDAWSLGSTSDLPLWLCDQAPVHAFLHDLATVLIGKPEPRRTGPPTSAARAPSDPKVIYLTWPAGHLARTSDGGRTWSARPGLLGKLDPQLPAFLDGMQLNGIAVHPDDPDTIYAATAKGLATSTDGGATFSFTALGFPGNHVPCRVVSATVVPVQPRQLLVATQSRVYRAALPPR